MSTDTDYSEKQRASKKSRFTVTYLKKFFCIQKSIESVIFQFQHTLLTASTTKLMAGAITEKIEEITESLKATRVFGVSAPSITTLINENGDEIEDVISCMLVPYITCKLSEREIKKLSFLIAGNLPEIMIDQLPVRGCDKLFTSTEKEYTSVFIIKDVFKHKMVIKILNSPHAGDEIEYELPKTVSFSWIAKNLGFSFRSEKMAYYVPEDLIGVFGIGSCSTINGKCRIKNFTFNTSTKKATTELFDIRDIQ
ncbi:MAG: hypothetical protein QW303_01995 [Nitrososphaerota archaeon]